MPGKPKKDPLAGEDDDEQSVNDRDVQSVKDGAKEETERRRTVARPSSSDDDDSDPVVDLESDDDDDDEPGVRPSRSERRRQRGANLVQQANAEKEAARREAQELRERVARMEGQFTATQQTQNKPAEKSEHEKEYEAACEEQVLLLGAYNAATRKQGGITQAEMSDFEKKARENERRRFRAVAKMEGGAQTQAPTADEVLAQARRQEIVAEHNDVITNQQAYRWAISKLGMEIAEGKPDTKATFDAAMEQARIKFGMQPKNKPSPSNAQRRRLTGMSRGGGSGGAQEGKQFVMTAEHRKMADSAFPHIRDKSKRYTAYAKAQMVDE